MLVVITNFFFNRFTQKKILETITFIILWDFFMFYQIFLSRQVRRCAIITYKNGI